MNRYKYNDDYQKTKTPLFPRVEPGQIWEKINKAIRAFPDETDEIKILYLSIIDSKQYPVWQVVNDEGVETIFSEHMLHKLYRLK